jgi:hypothetical protein
MASAGPALAADRAPHELPPWLSPILLLQPLGALRVEDRVDSRESVTELSLRRAEVGFRVGGALTAATLSVDLSRGMPEMRDAFIDVGLESGFVAVRGGYLRPPLGREYLAAGDRHALPAEPESLVVGRLQRELGVELHGRLLGILSYAAGAWSGAAEGADGEPRQGELLVLAGGRLVAEPLGPVPEEEGASDLAGGGPRLALGAAALWGRRGSVPFPAAGETGAEYREDRLRLGGEAALKWAGVSATGEIVWSTAKPAPGTSAALEPRLPRVNGVGGYLQLAAFVVRRRLELAARCDAWDEDVDVGGALVSPMAGVSFYALGAHVVVRLAYGVRFAVKDPFPPESPYHEPVTHRVLLMLQLSL